MPPPALLRNNNSSPAPPSDTTDSELPNYRIPPYKTVRDIEGAPEVPPTDARIIAKIHFDELDLFLGSPKGKCGVPAL